uniref:Uncharacterized protein n=1 Tax=Petromyzon marinus TaxID=7757 RepID=S4RRR2_PETMA
TYLEASGTPVHKLDRTFGFNGRDSSIDVLGHHVSSVQHAARHVFAVARVALHHLVGWLKAGIGDLRHRQLLMVCFLGRDDRGVGDQREVDARVGNQVGLELGEIDVEGTVEAQRGRDGRHDLADEAVEVGVGGALDVQVAAADVVDGLVVDHEGAVRVLQGGVGGEHRVVGLHHGRGDLGCWVDGELQLGLLAVVNRQALHEEGGKARARAATEAVEDEEALQTLYITYQLTNAVQHQVDDLLADGVVATSIVVGSVLLASDELLWVEQLPVRARAHLICSRKLQIHEDGAGHVFAGARLAEEGVERVVAAADGLVARHLPIGLDAVLQAVELPARVADLDTGLAHVDGDALALCRGDR